MPEEKLPPDWGLKWDPQIPYDGFKTCPHCGCELFLYAKDRGEDWFCYIVGFQVALPRPAYRDRIVGIFIFDCPRCQIKFWHHASLLNYKKAQELCPRWPKDEGSQPL